MVGYSDINFIKDIAVPIVIGVLSSVCFLFLISRVRPQLEISPRIAHSSARGEGAGLFIIKVINKSRRTAIDVKGRLTIVHKVNVGGGQISESREFNLLNCPFELPGKRGRTPEELERSAFRFTTRDDIRANWVNPSFISFSVVAKDLLTGFSGVYTKEYYAQDDVRGGDFEIGHSFTIR